MLMQARRLKAALKTVGATFLGRTPHVRTDRRFGDASSVVNTLTEVQISSLKSIDAGIEVTSYIGLEYNLVSTR